MAHKKSDKNTDVVHEGEVVVTKGRGGNANFPASRKGLVKTDEDRKLVSKIMTEILVEYRQPKVKSDEELAYRLDDYFQRCANSGQIPTIEEMCMSTGYTYSAVYAWETGANAGFSPETMNIIKKAKEICKTFDAKLVVAGKLNFLAYCFRAKNYYGMVDKQEHTLIATNDSGNDYDADQIKRLYADNPIDSGNSAIDSDLTTIDSEN